ncbi:MAG TPA: tetratricopeptide repeat protein [Phycisphaerae bacterium]|nr:tetratricopeptide repeat protein [Phycisphaerae bacterium]
MSYLLELLGRGLIAHLVGAFDTVFGKDTDETLNDLQHRAAQHPNDTALQVRLGGRYLRAENPAAAKDLFASILAREPGHVPARLGLACASDELGQLDAALDHLRIAQKTEPASPAVLFCLGFCHERRGGEAQAEQYYQDALRISPTLRNAHERLAAMALRADRLDAAIGHYQTLCELDPQHTDLHLSLANLLVKARRFPEAIARFEHALTLEPDNWTAHNDAVSAYEEAGLVREAIEHLHQMIQREPDAADTRLRLGDLYAKIGNDTAATVHYERAVQLCSDYLEANVKLGTQHLRAGRFADAAKWFSRALEINDRLLSAYVGIGVAQHAQGSEKDARASFEMARNIEPNSTLLFSEVARMHLKAAASQEAHRYLNPATPHGAAPPEQRPDLIAQQVDRLKEAIAANSNHADLHYRLGLLYRNRGQVEDAINCFRQATTINPSYMKALIKLGLALGEMDRLDEAVAVFQQALEVRPNYLDLHYQAGLLFAQRQRFEMAVEHFEHAATGNPRNVAFQANLALALQNMGLIDRAQATWQVVSDLSSADSPQGKAARAALAGHRQDQ